MSTTPSTSTSAAQAAADGLLQHVGAYASAVRTHLADLPPEQVEDLTDGLEADLAEALADARTATVAPAAGGGAAAGSGAAAPSAVLDVTARFGPAAAYAAELRAAAGLPPADAHPARVRARRAGSLALERAGAGVAAVRRTVAPLVATPGGRAFVGLVDLVRPVWWVLRGWLWFVLLRLALDTISWRGAPGERSVWQFVPDGAVTWTLALVALGVSLALGRRPVVGRAERAVVVGFSAAAVLTLPWAATSLQEVVEARLDRPVVVTERVPVGVEVPARVDDGVWVDGIQVSNLFVYDADGNPLEGVQVFDDRGRPVRTTDDGGWATYRLPGVADGWSFAPAHDADGRDRWNVYPLLGAPAPEWDLEAQGVRPALLEGGTLRLPPAPFAKAPAVVVGPGEVETTAADAFTASGGAGEGAADEAATGR